VVFSGAQKGLNREAGEIPARSRHCYEVRRFVVPLSDQLGKVKRFTANAVTSEPGNLPRTVCDLPAENRKRANRLSTLSPLVFTNESARLALPMSVKRYVHEYCDQTR
jgi:hypothetical protein